MVLNSLVRYCLHFGRKGKNSKCTHFCPLHIVSPPCNRIYTLNCLISCSNLVKLRRDESFLSTSKGLHFSNTSDIVVTQELVVADSSVSHNDTGKRVHAAPSSVLRKLRSNSSDVYLHVVLVKSENGRPVVNDITSNALTAGDALYDVIHMIKHASLPASFRHRYLLSDFGWAKHSKEEGTLFVNELC